MVLVWRFRYCFLAQGNIAGFLSFGRVEGYRTNVAVNTFPITGGLELGATPFLSPLWSSLNLAGGGAVFYRNSTNPALIEMAVARLAEDDEELRNKFSPGVVVVATWSEVAIQEEEPLKVLGGEGNLCIVAALITWTL